MNAKKVTANLYTLKGEKLKESEASTNCEEESMMMWHRKLGHISERGLKILLKQKLLSSLTKTSLPFCEHCVKNK